MKDAFTGLSRSPYFTHLRIIAAGDTFDLELSPPYSKASCEEDLLYLADCQLKMQLNNLLDSVPLASPITAQLVVGYRPSLPPHCLIQASGKPQRSLAFAKIVLAALSAAKLIEMPEALDQDNLAALLAGSPINLCVLA